MTRFAFAIFAFAAASVSAALVSDDSKMFFSGGDWLPDAVPENAIYDTPGATNEVLRVTTNVTAGVWSTLSGLLERRRLAYDYWPHKNDGTSALITVPELKTEFFIGLANDSNQNLAHLGYPTNREITSARLLANIPNTSVDILGTIREVMLALPNNTQFGYWAPRFSSTKIAEQIGGSVAFPTWDWTNLLEYVLVSSPSTPWRNAWVEYNTCINDGVWKTTAPMERTALKEVFETESSRWWSWADDETEPWLQWHINDIVNAPSEASCIAIITNRLGVGGLAITNNTRRLSYYHLGALQCAVGSMDISYAVNPCNLPRYDFIPVTYSQAKGWTSAETVSSLTWDDTAKTVSFSSSPQWQSYSNASAVTNEWGMGSDRRIKSNHPCYYFGGDSKTYHASVLGYGSNLAASIPASDISSWLAQGNGVCYINFSVSGRTITYEAGVWSNSWQQFATDSVTLEPTTLQLLRSAGALRSARLDSTPLDSATNDTFAVTKPSATAQSVYSPTYHLTAIETRYATDENLTGLYDPGPGWEINKSAVGTTMDDRGWCSAAIGTATPSQVEQMVQGERYNHALAVRALVDTRIGGHVEDIPSMIDFDLNLLNGIKTRAEAISSATYSVDGLCTHSNIRLESGANGIEVYDDYTWELLTTISAGSALEIGNLAISAEATGLTDPIPDIPSCSVESYFMPIAEVYWNFKNLHEETP